ncbi:type IV pilus twitching motility protein PilT [Clostridium botulinum]|uniref:type IV pilus twitching motility protein PilT n=1 Tax=Clostridium botulinum TaxID=1491 RepID=UPI0013F110B4|nr:type IV pilus twitching motility protein PilT [Clostridium botulinum]MBN1041495.1 type IV pilus twitching motility protein PilT [Clostridium botulinum]MBY6917031.1 type IV pilus twitching motility protein PilT [Clostridium botulinum]NFL33768.1 type IV pilus twitching motility protein PilT [Clostridium botulinum]NFM02183.1 type IV pilus twitching motility protein PilT [Clostridium botulinum]NFO29483.1 type IV pilus twitching motility protein PilT [Clostridium botulinum]
MSNIDKLIKSIDLNNVSDIHISSGLPPMIRIDGNLKSASNLVISHEEVDKYIRELAPERFEEFLEEGDIDFKYQLEGVGNFRVNAYKCKGKYSICLRVIKQRIPKISDITNAQILKDLTKLNDGLVLVTGPTGSGKSTTLAAMINEINNTKERHIITLEDPIEYIYENNKSIINQREVGQDTKSYVMGLRAALRQDPDVILIGEMRDTETIEVALRAAQTGHLVFSTLHTMGAANSIYRIINSFDNKEQNEIKVQLSSLLRGVVSQVLLPNATGVGRTAALEIMTCTTSIKNLIREGNYEQINSFIQMGSKYGMQTIDMDLKRLVNENIIVKEEYMKWKSNNN